MYEGSYIDVRGYKNSVATRFYINVRVMYCPTPMVLHWPGTGWDVVGPYNNV